MNPDSSYRADPRHSQLGGDFFDTVEAARFPSQILRFRNRRWARRVGLEELDDEGWLRHFAAFEPLPDNLDAPLALRYHGHQFRSYNPDLGDGRGFLFAQLRDSEDGRLLDLGTKGSGQTPWSRAGDGRLTLKGGVREVLATALLEALGVNTSKSFSLVETGEELMRGDEPSPTRSSVLVRLSHSHVRFGSFQRLAYLDEKENLQRLLDHSIAHYFPELEEKQGESRVAAFLERVVDVSADLAASWMVAGFVHGVLNTDNLNITGESFDYGPYRFLPRLDPGFTAAYFDQTGLYAYGRQVEAVGWNLQRLAEALLPIGERESLIEALVCFEARFQRSYCQRSLDRLGLEPVLDEGSDGERVLGQPSIDLVNAVNRFLHESELDYERFFFDWYAGEASRERAMNGPEADRYREPGFEEVERGLRAHAAKDPARLEQPYFERDRPVTLLIDEIEALWARISEDDDWQSLESKLDEIEEMRRALA